jgi:oligoribonuclease NrnB/cAMP/cGMP phosphodiesterase (DHH superfamily)
MARHKKIFCFTHYDLDGVVSYLVTKWAYPKHTLEYKAVVDSNIRTELTKWLLNNSFDDFEKVFFLDLDVSGSVDLIDKENVFIIDHHKTHVDNMKYKNCVAIVKEYPSACLLAYRAFKKIYDCKFTDAQKQLVLYGNDYDSYTNQYAESRMLNAIYYNTQKSFETFVGIYADGFVEFSKQQLAIYQMFENELADTIKNLKLYQGGYADVDGEYRVVVATFASRHINDIADHILNMYNSDVAIVVNLSSKHVSFRRPKDGTMKLDVFAKDIAGGGGHEYSAGGIISDAFLDFTKTLKPI